MKNLLKLSVLLAFCLAGCSGNSDYSPKRTGYFRIALPERKYTTYTSDCPFIFEYPVYATVDSVAGHPYWLNILFPQFRCNVYVSYVTIDSNLGALLEECRKFVVEHEVKASAINEQEVMNRKDKIYGMIYDIEGNAASNMQFYLTDSTHNFIRGALYFYAVPNKDSLQPVANFVKEDINHLIQTFRWKKNLSAAPTKP
jgi:gliding motility-associated lipoprotein GldD